ncbi:MAG TPA: hypothetical protein VHY91_08160 [Pirellulales bacterium]|jgi:hypothetical protein|nr:hypothetical protein [Pirellulales bacterium]
MPRTTGDPNVPERTRYAFTLVLSAAELTDEIASAIYALGLDDALVGQSAGSVYVDLDVEDACYADAIVNSIQQIERALPGTRVIGVHPPGRDTIELINAYLKTRGSETSAQWSKLLAKI